MKSLNCISLINLEKNRLNSIRMRNIVGGNEIYGCCGCGCRGTSSSADNASANVVGFRHTPNMDKGNPINTKMGYCIQAVYDTTTNKYTEIDQGSNC